MTVPDGTFEVCPMCASRIEPGNKHVRNFATRGNCVEVPDEYALGEAGQALLRDVQAASVQP